ncbi:MULTISPECIES: glycosyltransferase family 2 protein [Halomonadaceae]|uniref:glycosyltransferase family 2 protein n=1 Tax=Halomonadaceae TaxID=28256 RepID=UPI001583A705|nr:MULTISPECIES: glycosyltransferase family A protein [Halomonas]MDI4636236.1 glycosyltransferase family 2 protein [Halomonas sp. BMC7]NUJ60599.1 glycosyltransferase family 2 protein [Halomonas taeanensis]
MTSSVPNALKSQACWWLEQYAHAVALRPAQQRPDARQLWALFRLGMYSRVAEAEPLDGHWRGQFAQAASLAACGDTEAAGKMAERLFASRRLRKRGPAFLQALAAFSPALAERHRAQADLPESSLLPTGLSVRLGDDDQARHRLRAWRAANAHTSPEYHLLEGHLHAASPGKQLAAMNGFLAAHGLVPIGLHDPDAPAGVMNLCAASRLPAAEGPLVSVLMTTFRSGPRAEQAIRSLLAQTYRNLEIIVVDDASTDDTLARLEAMAEQDSRVRCLQLPSNAGTYVAKSIGLRHARGEFVTCHDSDDWSHPEKIARQVRPLLAKPKLVATTSQWVRLQDDGRYYVRQVLPFTRLNPSSPLFRRQRVLDAMGAWDWVRTGADSEFLARLKLVFGRGAVKRLVEPLAFGAHRDDSLMTAKETGHLDNAVSPVRLAYWEAWNDWHIAALRLGDPLYMPLDMLADRRFAAPAEIQVANASTRQALR